MNNEQRLLAGFLVFIGVVALILGFVQTRQGISASFTREIPNSKFQIPNDSGGEDTVALKAKDTDQDGLNDYDELRVYRTSPYIADSDSDGIHDGEEVKKGTDPNCPQGKKCASQESLISPSGDLFSALKPPTTMSSGQGMGASVQLGANASAAQLRVVLQQSGQIAPDLLAKLSDQELLDTWTATVGAKDNNAISGSSTSVGSGTSTQLPSPAEMRAFFKNQGMSEQLLNSISDEQLQKILQEKLKQK